MTELTEALNTIVCDEQGQQFVTHQMEIMDAEITKLDELLIWHKSRTTTSITTKAATTNISHAKTTGHPITSGHTTT